MIRRLVAAGGVAAMLALVVPAAPVRSPAIQAHGLRSLLRGTSLYGPDALRLLAGPPTDKQCQDRYGENCYSPLQLRKAYDLNPLYRKGDTGKGRTIVIVDSFGSPTIRHDLTVFDDQYGIAAPPSFQIIQPAGKDPAYNPNSDMVGWAAETTLDVEYSHAVAPGAKILLVETPVDETIGAAGFPQIVQAENYVINHNLGDVISQSFGTSEISFTAAHPLTSYRSDYVNAEKHHVTVLAASGDEGPTQPSNAAATTYYTKRNVGWPASDPLVTAIGGTTLHLDVTGARTSADTVWNDTRISPAASGGGHSVVFGRPGYQTGVQGVVGTRRGLPDISMSASCSGSVLVYSSFAPGPAGWSPICGTSEATPLFAGVVALADQYAGKRLGLLNPALYKLYAEHSTNTGLVPVTSGNTTVSFDQNGHRYTVTGFAGAKTYNLAIGVGTILGAVFVPALAKA
jgi:subtilase family serine protease